MSVRIALAVALLLINLQALIAQDETILRKIAVIADRSSKRLESESATWTIRHAASAGASIDVRVRHSPLVARYLFVLTSMEKRTLIASLYVTDKVWYFESADGRGKFRPWEVPFPAPALAFMLTRSHVDLLTSDALAMSPPMRLSKIDRNRVEVRSQLPAAQRAQLSEMIAKLEELARMLAGEKQGQAEELRQQMATLQDGLTNGLPMVIDSRTGVILERGFSSKKVEVLDFTWLDGGTQALLPAECERWPDRTIPFIPEQMKDVIQIMHIPGWHPDRPSGEDSDLMLLNLRSGEVKRVPFPGVAQAGTFSRDRQKAYISGTLPEGGSVTLFECDLTTGATRPIGDESTRTGIWLFPQLSADGKQLAACRVFGGKGLESQIYVIDLATDRTTPIGAPMDTSGFVWSPDGQRLICHLREGEESYIASLGLDGRVQKLCEGGWPNLLPDGRIHFVGSDDLHRTCTLAGTDVRLIGDGLANYRFAAASGDGRMVMMRYDEKLPRLFVLHINTGELWPVKLGAGHWSRPAWR